MRSNWGVAINSAAVDWGTAAAIAGLLVVALTAGIDATSIAEIGLGATGLALLQLQRNTASADAKHRAPSRSKVN